MYLEAVTDQTEHVGEAILDVGSRSEPVIHLYGRKSVQRAAKHA